MCDHDPEMLAWYYVGVAQRREPRWTLHLPEMWQDFCNLSYWDWYQKSPICDSLRTPSVVEEWILQKSVQNKANSVVGLSVP